MPEYHFDWDNNVLGSYKDYKEWMFRFYEKFAPKKVFEIGVGPGGSSLAYFLANPKGKLVSVDIEDRSETVSQIKALIGHPVDWTQIWDDSRKVIKETNEKFDLVYVDGDHRLDGAYHDALYSDKLLDNGGIILFDDAGNVWKDNICGAISKWQIDCPWYEEFTIDLGIVNPDGPRMFGRIK